MNVTLKKKVLKTYIMPKTMFVAMIWIYIFIIYILHVDKKEETTRYLKNSTTCNG